jgi:methionyl-tRNA synthetase
MARYLDSFTSVPFSRSTDPEQIKHDEYRCGYDCKLCVHCDVCGHDHDPNDDHVTVSEED